MKKILANFIAAFVPVRSWRHRVRKAIRHNAAIVGTNNKIIVHGKEFKGKIKGLHIEITGNNNTIKIADPSIFTNSRIIIKSNGVDVSIGTADIINNLFIFANYGGNNQKCSIGNNIVCIHGLTVWLHEDGAELKICDNCMLSSGIEIWASDGHSIIDCNTNKLINRSTSPIIIGEHCWIAKGVRFLKKASIPADTIVGSGAIVSKTFTETNTIIAGNPAKIIKRDVRWEFPTPSQYEMEHSVK
jgi:acetyltransferase-like isoleucine patch superfamily enzyme